MLKMKAACEKCDAALQETGLARICSFECTFCEPCSATMSNVCPNCGGELVKRPTRVRKPTEVAMAQAKSKIRGIFKRG